MTEEENNVDIITKTPENLPQKTKDPKGVEAGRKLAEYNKKANEAKKKVVEEQESKEEKSYLPSLMQISALLGIGLTLINIFFGI